MDPFNNRPKSSVKYELESESQNEGTLNNNDYDLEVSKNEENEKEGTIREDLINKFKKNRSKVDNIDLFDKNERKS